MYSAVASLGAIGVSKLQSSELQSGLPLQTARRRRCIHCTAVISNNADSRRHTEEHHPDQPCCFRMEDVYVLATRPERLVAIRQSIGRDELPEWQQELQDSFDVYMSSVSQHTASSADERAHAPVIRATGWPAILDIKLDSVTTEELQRLSACSVAQTSTETRVLARLDHFIQQLFAQLDSRVRLVGEDITQILATDEADGFRHFEGAQKPLLVSPDTRERYALHWSRLVFTGLKAARLDEGSPLRSCLHHLRSEELELLENIWDALCDEDEHESTQEAQRIRCLAMLTDFSLGLVQHVTTEKCQAGAGLLLVYASLAAIKVSAVDSTHTRFRREVEFAPIASALIYCGRTMAMVTSVGRDSSSSGDAPLRDDQLWSHVRHLQQQHLSNGRPRPISTLVRWRRWCQAVMASETGQVAFDPCSGTLCFEGEDWSLAGLQQFAQGQLRQLRVRLDDLFSFGGLLPGARAGPLPPLSLGSSSGWELPSYGLTHPLVLSKVSRSLGWWMVVMQLNSPVLSIPQNKPCDTLPEVLLRTSITAEMLDVEEGSSLKETFETRLLGSEERFLEALVLAVHCLSGNAARSTELLSAMATDTSVGPRSVFSGVDGETYITLPHSKTRHTDRPGKLVARFLPMALNTTFF